MSYLDNLYTPPPTLNESTEALDEGAINDWVKRNKYAVVGVPLGALGALHTAGGAVQLGAGLAGKGGFGYNKEQDKKFNNELKKYGAINALVGGTMLYGANKLLKAHDKHSKA